MDIWCNFIWNTFDFGKLFHITFHLKLIEKIFIYARLFQKQLFLLSIRASIYIILYKKKLKLLLLFKFSLRCIKSTKKNV